MVGGDFAKRRADVATCWHGLGAAGDEGAALGGIDGTGDFSAQYDSFAGFFYGWIGDGYG